MPVTPFHGGLGLLAKGCLGRRFSFASFCATQVALDLESGYYLLRDEWPYHRFVHTPLGATAVCAGVALVFGLVGAWLGRGSSAPSTHLAWLRADVAGAASVSAGLVTIVTGVLGHLIPDGIMHSDVRLWPLFDVNPLYRLMSLAALHWSLVLAGVLGALLMLLNALRADRSRT